MPNLKIYDISDIELQKTHSLEYKNITLYSVTFSTSFTVSRIKFFFYNKHIKNATISVNLNISEDIHDKVRVQHSIETKCDTVWPMRIETFEWQLDQKWLLIIKFMSCIQGSNVCVATCGQVYVKKSHIKKRDRSEHSYYSTMVLYYIIEVWSFLWLYAVWFVRKVLTLYASE